MTPDNLFRNKLENFQRTAPVGAWDKIEQNLDKRSKPVIVWMRVAAGIALLATATVLVWPSQKDDQVLSDNTKPTTPKNEVTQPVTIDTATQQLPTPKTAGENFTASAKSKTVDKKQRITAPIQTPEKKDAVTIPDQSQNEPLIAEAIPSIQQNLTEVQAKNEVVIASNTITYSTEEVESKFLKKKVTPQATSEPTDASTMQKLIGLAYAAKNSDADIGGLRQKKDEILALNFRNKKGEN